MPTFNRRTLRQSLGRDYLHDTLVSTTTGSCGVTTGSLAIWDSSTADPTASGEGLYHRQWLRLVGSAGHIQDLRVGSWNTGSGAFVAAVTLATTVYSGMPYEVHATIKPTDKDRALDAVIQNVRVRRELTIDAINGGHIYSLGPDVVDVVGVRYFSDPAASLDRGEHAVDWWKHEATGSGNELRITPALYGSYQLVLDAITTVSLGAGDLATVNLPNDEWILWGAAARCLWMAEQQSPGQEAGRYSERRKESAREYSRLSSRFQPFVTRKIQLDELW